MKQAWWITTFAMMACGAGSPCFADDHLLTICAPSDGEPVAFSIADLLTRRAIADGFPGHVQSEQRLSADQCLKNSTRGRPGDKTLVLLSRNVHERLAPNEDLHRVVEIAGIPYFLVLAPQGRVHSVAELIELSKKGMTPVAFGIAKDDSVAARAVDLFAPATRRTLSPVWLDRTFRNTPAAISSPLDVALEESYTALPHVRAKRLEVLLTTALRRLPVTPGVPAASELTPGYELVNSIALFASAGMPEAETKALHREFDRIAHSLPISVRLSNVGLLNAPHVTEVAVVRSPTLASHATPPAR
jgi:hypothetical protein